MLKGKVAIVTGGTKGIGKGIADKLSENGAKVVVSARHEEKTNHHFVKCDVSSFKGVQKMVDETVKKYGKVDILVNNAGIYPGIELKDMTEDQWNRVMDVNLNGVFNCVKLVLPFMMKQKSGNIINIASIAGVKIGFPGLVHYCTTKAGVEGFTKAAALEMAPYNIRVNAIAPGLIVTPGIQEFMNDKDIKDFVKTVPLKKAGSPVDIAEAALFLSSEKSQYITGQTIVVDGGYTIQ